MNKALIIILIIFSNRFFAQGVSLELDTLQVHDAGVLAGMTTYQLWARLDSTDERVIMVYGDKNSPLNIASSTSFWQSPYGKSIGSEINSSFFEFDMNLYYDSWVTIEFANSCIGCPAVMKAESPTKPWSPSFEEGNPISINDAVGGAWFLIEPYPMKNNRVLLGQFTTDGNINAVVNLTLFNVATRNKRDVLAISVIN